MGAIDEDEEIDVLLGELEKEGIDNIDWGELGIGLNEVKEIVENTVDQCSSEAEEDEDETEDETEDEEEREIKALLENLEKEGIDERKLKATLANDRSKSDSPLSISIVSQAKKPVQPAKTTQESDSEYEIEYEEIN